jgi:hypothetical protein
VAGAAIALAGCGGEPLSEPDEQAVARAVGDISFYCPHAAAPERPAPTHIDRAVERLISIYRKDPDALHMEGHEEETSITRVMELAERQLRWCDPRIADRVKREL